MVHKTSTIGSGGDHSTMAAWNTATEIDLVTATDIEEGRLLEQLSAGSHSMSNSSANVSASYYRILTHNGTPYDPVADSGPGLIGTGDYATALNVTEDHAKITGILIKKTTNTNGAALATEGPTGVVIDGVFAWKTTTGDCGTIASGGYGRTSTITIRNTIAFNPSGTTGFRVWLHNEDAASVIQNCVCYGNGTAGNGFETTFNNAGIVATNCIAVNTGGSGDFYKFWSSGATQYCISGDTTADDGTDYDSETISDIFEDAANRDFRIKSTGNAWDNGTSLSGSFTTSLDGTTRSGTWDIGAYDSSSTGGGGPAPGEFLRRSEHLPAPNPLLRM